MRWPASAVMHLASGLVQQSCASGGVAAAAVVFACAGAFGLGVGLLPRPCASALRFRRGERRVRSFCLRPAIAATRAVACSAARVGCERLTVESLRELRGSRFCSLRTSGSRRATGRRLALRQYLPWAVPTPVLTGLCAA